MNIIFNEPPLKNDLVECALNDYFSKNDNYIGSYEKSLISTSSGISTKSAITPAYSSLVSTTSHGTINWQSSCLKPLWIMD